MHPYEEVLRRIVEQMLMHKECEAENQLVIDNLVILMRYRLRDIARTTSNAASHAGRCTACYFDVERTFRMLGIGVSGLREIRYADPKTQPPGVTLPPTEIRDEDYHQCSQLDFQQRGTRSGRHIPKHLPSFPGLHTYKNTMMSVVTDRSYAPERERSAQLQRNGQRALNSFLQRTMPTVSLFSGRHPKKKYPEYSLLNIEPPMTPAYLAALMPESEVYDTDIYKGNTEINVMDYLSRNARKPSGVQSEYSDDEEIDRETETESREARASEEKDKENEGETNETKASKECKEEDNGENEIKNANREGTGSESSEGNEIKSCGSSKVENSEDYETEDGEENQTYSQSEDEYSVGSECEYDEETNEEDGSGYSDEIEKNGSEYSDEVESESSGGDEIEPSEQSKDENETNEENGSEYSDEIESESSGGDEIKKEIENKISEQNEIKTCNQNKVENNEENVSKDCEENGTSEEKQNNSECSAEHKKEGSKEYDGFEKNANYDTVDSAKEGYMNNIESINDDAIEKENMEDINETMTQNDNENVNLYEENPDVDWEMLDLYRDE
ncbi:hypothetical protein AWZ03_000874 [Drosophila navojoa]|uniref:Transcription initiation factor TFIID subunit 8 n=1 Tax=Drosophila navojoa TaxID=7232 RepID=A0A484BY70_DRONA|nr:hypothetical protein AWZ03_000874 [Drosophila navojoa]